eukprot:4008260-Pyramimonas_sp.AAC.1
MGMLAGSPSASARVKLCTIGPCWPTVVVTASLAARMEFRFMTSGGPLPLTSARIAAEAEAAQ